MDLSEIWAVPAVLAGVFFLAAFVRGQYTNGGSLLNVSLFGNRTFACSCLAAFLFYASTFVVTYFLSLYLQSVGAMTSSEAGLTMMVETVVMAVLTPVFGRLSDRVADKRILPTAGLIVTAAGTASFMFYGIEADMNLILFSMIVTGAGAGMFTAPNTSAIMGSVPPAETDAASAIFSYVRHTGMMAGMAATMIVIMAVMGSEAMLDPETQGAFVEAIDVSFAFFTVMCIIGIFVSVLRGSPEKSREIRGEGKNLRTRRFRQSAAYRGKIYAECHDTRYGL